MARVLCENIKYTVSGGEMGVAVVMAPCGVINQEVAAMSVVLYQALCPDIAASLIYQLLPLHTP